MTAHRSQDDAQALSTFFAAFRQQAEVGGMELSRFFHQFEEAYGRARSDRAAATPHFDVLRVFGLGFSELRHSDALAWFLDPEAEHEQGALFANTLLGLCGAAPASSECYTVERERHGRVDVAFYEPGQFAVFIENKVRHSESDQQVSRMVGSLVKRSVTVGVPREKRFAIFLTDTGAKPVTGPCADSPGFLVSNLISLRRVEIFEAFRTALDRQPAYSSLLVNFIDSYLASTRRLRSLLA